MKQTDPLATMSKTQNYMHSTLVPMSSHRRRYQEGQSTVLRRSVMQRSGNPELSQLSASLSKEHRQQLKTPNLPQIRKERSLMLQQWLNQALEGETEVSSSLQPLATLKKYEMDKGNLRNLDLSHQIIQRLYKGLYVHTEGVKLSFNEILGEAQRMPRGDNLLPKIYFKVFLKLLQNLLPVKSCFQMIEDQHLKEIQDLKKQRAQLITQLQKEKKRGDEIEHRFQKELDDQANKMKTLMMDYKITESNLSMYEKSFNEEVFLRLKFQEKINQAYSCYQELKEKYDMMKQEMNIKNNELLSNNKIQISMKEQLLTQSIRNGEIQKQVQLLQEKIIVLQGYLIIKNQEIFDIKIENQGQQQKKMAEQIALDELMTTISHLRKHKEESQLKVNQFTQQITGHMKTIEKLKNNLLDAREKNDQLYVKHHEATLKLMPLEKLLFEKNISLAEIAKETSSLKNVHGMKEYQFEQSRKRFSQMEVDLENQKKKNLLLQNQIGKMNETFSELKDSKDRYERLNFKLKQQLAKSREELEKKVNENVDCTSKNAEQQLRIDTLEKTTTQFKGKINRLQKNLIEKQTDLENMQASTRKKVKDTEWQLKQREMELQAKNQAFHKALTDSNQKDSERIKKLQEISFLRKLNSLLEGEIKQVKLKLEQMNADSEQKNNEIVMLNKQLSGQSYAISKKKGEMDEEKQNLRLSLSKLKQKKNSTIQYVHPMIVEDMFEQIVRLQTKINRIKEENMEFNNQYSSLQVDLNLKNNEVSNGAEELVKLTKDIQYNNKLLNASKDEIKQHQMQLNQKNIEVSKVRQEMNTLIQNQKKAMDKKEEQIKRYIKENQKFKKEQQSREKSLKKSVIKPQIRDSNSQTDELNESPIEMKLSSSVSIQTDNFSLSNLKKLSSQKARRKNQDEQVSEIGSIVSSQNEIKQSNLGSIVEQKYPKERELSQRQPEKKVQQRQFKAALKITYMRK